MNLVLGIDGGGTHTRAYLATMQGEVLGTGEGGPSNPNTHGMQAAQGEILHAIRLAFEDAGIEGQKVAAACLGIGGTDRAGERDVLTAWAKETLADRVRVVNDGEILLAAGTPDDWGVALVAGTGSIAWARSREGKVTRAGGWGYLIGDEGSGFDLARNAVRAACQAADGRGPQTRLLDALLEQWGLARPIHMVSHVYVGKPTDLAKLAPLVLRIAEEGDTVARQLVTDAAESLAAAASAVCASLDMQGAEIPLALTGGLLLASESIRSHLLSTLLVQGYAMNPVTLVHEPVRGALRLARKLLL